MSGKNVRERYSTDQRGEQVICCNEIVRRDEFVPHWRMFHLDTQLSVDQVIQRCPFMLYGCTYARENLAPMPAGTTLRYNSEIDTFLVQPPTNPSSNPPAGENSQYEQQIKKKQELALYGYGDDEDESYDVMGQLPVEVLMTIFQFLDSVALWSLSQTNHYLRKICFNFVKERGIVYTRWKKGRDLTIWTPSPKVFTIRGIQESRCTYITLQ